MWATVWSFLPTIAGIHLKTEIYFNFSRCTFAFMQLNRPSAVKSLGLLNPVYFTVILFNLFTPPQPRWSAHPAAPGTRAGA